MKNVAQERTEVEINDLKKQWMADACWDIENSSGFEAHHDELLLFRKQCEAKWENEARAKLEKRAESLGCPGNLKLAQYVECLEERIDCIMDRLENRCI